MDLDAHSPLLVTHDLAYAEAVRDHLLGLGIAARMLIEDDGAGRSRVEVHVPPPDRQRAKQIIEQGDWPRLA